MMAFVQALPPGCVWSGFGISRMEMPMLAQAMLLGGNLHGEARLSQSDVAGLCEWSRNEATRLLTTAIHFAAQIPDGSDGWRIPESAATEQSPVPVSPAAIARG